MPGEDMPTEFLECRLWGHAWKAGTVSRDRASGAFDQGLVCIRCGGQRAYVLDRRGRFVKRRPYSYPDGYLMPKGTGRLSSGERDDLRAELAERYAPATRRRRRQ
jgi:hypothetical protein